MLNTTYQLIIFDWDGTLMDSEAQITACLRAAIIDVECESRTDEQLRNIIGLGLEQAIRHLFPKFTAQQLNHFADRYRQHFLYGNSRPAKLFKGARELITQLRQSEYQLAIATGKGRRGLEHVLNETGMKNDFDCTRCAGETRSKPDPLMLNEILTYLDIEPSLALMVGDTEYDMAMASNAQVDALAISHGVHHPDRLLKYNPISLVNSIHELQQWFNRITSPQSLTLNR